MSGLRRRWELDFDQVAAKIPESWFIRDGEFVGIHPDYRNEPIVQLYAGLAQVGYARGWL
jgi:hypothetical protein